MGIFSKIKKVFKKNKRGFDASKVSNLLNDWNVSNESADDVIKQGLKRLRSRSRDMAINNDYAKRFLNMVTNNIVGASGIKLQCKARDNNGALDKEGNRIIEEQWKEWGEKENASVTGQLTWVDTQRLVAETVAKDGEVFVRKIPYNNEFKFSLQIIEGDHLDEELNKILKNGNTIRMGIEYDKWMKPQAYHFLKNNPNDSLYGNGKNSYERVPASEIIHVYIMDRPNQSRGVPWMASSLKRLKMIGAFEESELVSARIASCKMGMILSPDGQHYTGDETDATGQLIENASPGQFVTLPNGYDFKSFDPTHPTSNFGNFVKAILRGASSGLNVSYNNLANDLEGVNFSSARFGELDERDQWRTKQNWFIESLIKPVYSSWLKNGMLSGKIPLPMSKIEKFLNTRWVPRGWDWVDPLKDTQSNILAVKNGLKTLTEVIGEQGKDFEDVLDQVASEREKMEKLGISFDEEITKPVLEKVD